jgi:hypothetical protein
MPGGDRKEEYMKNIQLSRGQTVTIYDDPITKKKPEGKAKLIKFVGKDDYFPYAETWVVQFLDELSADEYLQRTIIPD